MITPEKSALPSPAFDHIADYEAWAAQYWLHVPGSIEAQLHARAKLDEETQELIAAISSGTPQEVVSEAGDVLWTATAAGSNAGITISEVLLTAFPGYLSPNAPVKTAEIDPLARMLFDGINSREIADYLREGERILGKTAKQWFVLKDTVSTPEKTFADAWINLKRTDAAEALLNLTMLISYIAQQYASADLKSVLEANYQKIEQRIQTGATVTKPPRELARR